MKKKRELQAYVPPTEAETQAEKAERVRPPRQARSVRILNIILLTLLIGSLIYSIVMICVAPSNSAMETTKSSYTLMLLQSVLGLVVMFLPSLLERKLKIDIPTFMEITFIVFLYCAIFLGEIRAYYTKVKHWDTVLHTFSGLMIASIGFSLVNILNKSNRMHISLSPGFVAIFAFSFAMALNSIWEIYEFAADELFGMNMQKFIPPQWINGDTKAPLNAGVEELGEFYRNKSGYKYALMDTMKDLVVDLIGAVVVSLGGYIALKLRKRSILSRLLIKNLVVADGSGGLMPAEDEAEPENGQAAGAPEEPGNVERG